MKLLPEGMRYLDEELNIPYPWYTKPCLEWLIKLNLKGKRIFEYGVGDSTFWYQKMDASVWGVDDSYNWIEFATEVVIDKYDYTHYINGFAKFDIVIIDGAYRDECTAPALKRIKKGGYLIIDNYKQPSVQEHWPLTEVLITGMPVTIYKQQDHEDWQTAVIRIL